MIGFMELGYLGLFLASFLAATVVPFSSEAIFTGCLIAGMDPWTCVWVATLGNWLGGMTSYYVGLLGKIEWIEKYFHIKKEKMESYTVRIQKYGDWFAFFSFVPFIGDVIAVATGFFRCNWWKVAISMLIGKFARYVVWMYFNGLFIK